MLTNANANNSPGFLQVLLALKENIFYDLQVATVCLVTQKNEDGTAMCRDFAESVSFQARYLHAMDLEEGDVVLVLFADKDFRTNLKKVMAGNYEFTPNSELETRHTKANGIIVGVVYRHTI